jgi:hypothetical protein
MTGPNIVRDERGFAMVLVVFLGVVLSILGLTLLITASNESDRSAQAVKRSTAFQAAEAGINDYVSKLVEDRLYYGHYVAAGESTRRPTVSGTDKSAGSAWPYPLSWTYPNGADTWRNLSNGYQYNLQIAPPAAGTLYVKITAIGRRINDTSDKRTVEALIRPSSLADFYRVVNGNVNWGAGATTNGKIYANGNIDHDGIATADIFAEGQITGSVSMQNGSKQYDVDSSPTIRSKIKTPINFASFLTSFVDVAAAAQYGGIYMSNPAKAAWRFTFNSNGTVGVESCVRAGSPLRDVADLAPTCTTQSGSPFQVPSNGAIYTTETAIVRGAVKGRVTVASADNIVIADNISYVTPGQDVLGLVATNNVEIARYTPNVLTWTAGVLAQNGTWETFVHDGSHSTMNFTGSSATNLGGDLTMFDTRNYGYAPELQYLPPPWFPIIQDAYTVLLFRELPST